MRLSCSITASIRPAETLTSGLDMEAAKLKGKKNDCMKIFFLMLVKYLIRNGCKKGVDGLY